MARVVQFKIQALNPGNTVQVPGQIPLLVRRTFKDTGDIGQRLRCIILFKAQPFPLLGNYLRIGMVE